jgi:hypothetical protein
MLPAGEIKGKVRGDLDRRLDKIELATVRQRRVNEAILAYVEADVAATWMGSARDLAKALKEALE